MIIRKNSIHKLPTYNIHRNEIKDLVNKLFSLENRILSIECIIIKLNFNPYIIKHETIETLHSKILYARNMVFVDLSWQYKNIGCCDYNSMIYM